jgi:hypothetical protein
LEHPWSSRARKPATRIACQTGRNQQAAAEAAAMTGANRTCVAEANQHLI